MVDIPPNFGVQEFDSEEQAIEYLEKLGFALHSRRSDYLVYETWDTPKKRANIFETEGGRFRVSLLIEKGTAEAPTQPPLQ